MQDEEAEDMVTMKVDIAHLVEQTKAPKFAPEGARGGASFAVSLKERAAAAVFTVGKPVAVASTVGLLTSPLTHDVEMPAAAAASSVAAPPVATIPIVMSFAGDPQAVVPQAIQKDPIVITGPRGVSGRSMITETSMNLLSLQESQPQASNGVMSSGERPRSSKGRTEVKTAAVQKQKAMRGAAAESIVTVAQGTSDIEATEGVPAVNTPAIEMPPNGSVTPGALSGLNKSVEGDGGTRPKTDGVVASRASAISRKTVDVGEVSTAKLPAARAASNVAITTNQGPSTLGDVVDKGSTTVVNAAVSANPSGTVHADGVAGVAIVSHATAGTLSHELRLNRPAREISMTLMPSDVPQMQSSSMRSGLESGDGLGLGVLAATAKTLEIGVVNGPHGWLKIRAEMDGDVVTASLSARSVAGQEVLHRDLPALTTYLQEERISVHAVVVERPSVSNTTMSELGTDLGGGEGSAQAQGQDRHEQGRNYMSEPSWGSSEEAAPYMERTHDAGLLSVIQRDTGGWLNVRV